MQSTQALKKRCCVIRYSLQLVRRSTVHIFIPYERSFSLVFWEEERSMEATPSTWNCGLTGPRCSEIADFEPTLARSASAVIHSEKKFNNLLTLIESPLRAFQWAYDDHHSLPLSPQRGAQNGKRPFSTWNRISLEESLLCQRQSCKAFIGVTIRAQMIGGDVPFLLSENLVDDGPPVCK